MCVRQVNWKERHYIRPVVVFTIAGGDAVVAERDRRRRSVDAWVFMLCRSAGTYCGITYRAGKLIGPDADNIPYHVTPDLSDSATFGWKYNGND